MKRYFKIFILVGVLVCLAACDFSKHPTGNPKEDAAVYHAMLYKGDVQGANKYLDEVRDLYLQDFINDRGAKVDKFWEEVGKLSK